MMKWHNRSRFKRSRPIGPTVRLERLLGVVADFGPWTLEVFKFYLYYTSIDHPQFFLKQYYWGFSFK